MYAYTIDRKNHIEYLTQDGKVILSDNLGTLYCSMYEPALILDKDKFNKKHEQIEYKDYAPYSFYFKNMDKLPVYTKKKPLDCYIPDYYFCSSISEEPKSHDEVDSVVSRLTNYFYLIIGKDNNIHELSQNKSGKRIERIVDGILYNPAENTFSILSRKSSETEDFCTEDMRLIKWINSISYEYIKVFDRYIKNKKFTIIKPIIQKGNLKKDIYENYLDTHIKNTNRLSEIRDKMNYLILHDKIICEGLSNIDVSYIFTIYSYSYDRFDADKIFRSEYDPQKLQNAFVVEASNVNTYQNDNINLLSCVSTTPVSDDFSTEYIIDEIIKSTFPDEIKDSINVLLNKLPELIDLMNINLLDTEVSEDLNHFSEYMDEIRSYLLSIKNKYNSDDTTGRCAATALLIPGNNSLSPIYTIHKSGQFDKCINKFMQTIAYSKEKECAYTSYSQFYNSFMSEMRKLLTSAYNNYLSPLFIAGDDKYNEDAQDTITYYFRNMNNLHLIMKAAVDDNSGIMRFKNCPQCSNIYRVKNNNQKYCDICMKFSEHFLPNKLSRTDVNNLYQNAKRFIINNLQSLSKAETLDQQDFYKFILVLRKVYAVTYYDINGDKLRNIWKKQANEDFEECLYDIKYYFNGSRDIHKYNSKVRFEDKAYYYPILCEGELKLEPESIEIEQIAEIIEENSEIEKISCICSRFSDQQHFSSVQGTNNLLSALQSLSNKSLQKI